MRADVISLLKKIDRLLDKQYPVFIALILVLILRVPNLTEPYWYGDEGIYLTIGQALNKGLVLYKDIIDHKTPLIYVFAQTHTQLNFRLFTILWMLGTTTAFYYFAQRIFSSTKTAFLATLIFVLATTLPSFEGNIPNGELFVMGFIMFGALLLSYSNYFTRVLHPTSAAIATKPFVLIGSGSMMALGILTKVPAIFDVAAFFAIGYFSFTNTFLKNRTIKIMRKVGIEWFYFTIGLAVPIIISILFFLIKNAGQEYLDFGLLYNFRYAGSWQLPFTHPALLFAFTLTGKLLFLLLLTAILTLCRKYIAPNYQFILLWFGAALVASLLSNRPYPHYYLQIMPPFSLLLGGLLIDSLQVITSRSLRKPTAKNVVTPILGAILIAIFVQVLLLLNVGLYETKSYYVRWWQLATGSITKAEYDQKFDSLMKDNYEAAELIVKSSNDRLFIWGTNPMLYALTQKTPTGRFTVSFHIKDFSAYEETYNDLLKHSPDFIVVMHAETSEFPEFYTYLHTNYMPNRQFDHFELWKKTNSVW